MVKGHPCVYYLYTSGIKAVGGYICLTNLVLFSVAGTRFRVKPEVQGRQIHNRAGTYDQGQWLGLTQVQRGGSASPVIPIHFTLIILIINDTATPRMRLLSPGRQDLCLVRLHHFLWTALLFLVL